MLIDDRYRLQTQLGEGGFGQVWKAFDEQGQYAVALKLFPDHSDQNPLWYWNELSILRSHRVPGIAELLDEGLWEKIPYLVMELVQGTPFPGKGPLDTQTILQRAIKLLDVLAMVHAEGILHHDITPNNVLVNDAGQPILVDFGIAADLNVDLMNSQPHLYGNLEYIAPERLLGKDPSLQSDLYSVGVMLYKALTGKAPFQEEDSRRLLQACVSRKAPLLGPQVRSLPRDIALTIDSLLFKHPEQRPNSAADLADMLRGIEPTAPDIPEWLAAHSIDIQSADSIPKADLISLFAGTERLFHERSQTAAELHKRTQGRPSEIHNEIGVWLLQGARFEGDRLRVGQRALKSSPLPDIHADATPEARLGRAYALIAEGPLDRAIQELMRAVNDLRGRPKHSDQELDIYERLLSAWMEIAMADSTKRVLGPLQFELHRAPATPHIQKLDKMASAAAAIAAGGPKALDILNDIEPFEDIRLETRRHGARSVAARRCAPAILKKTLDSIGAWAEGYRANPMVWGRYQFWQGWYAYHQGDFLRAAEFHLEASRHAIWPIEKASALIAAASALMETLPKRDSAISIAQQALAQVQACESPFLEARAEWVLRAARYRNQEDLEPDEDLIQSVQRLTGAPDIEAQVYFTEATFAFRKGNRTRAQELAQMAANLWKTRKSLYNYALAQAFAWAMGHNQASTTDTEPLRQLALKCPLPEMGLQTLAFLGEAAPGDQVVSPKHLEKILSAIPDQHWQCRMDILSVDEAREKLGHPKQ